MGCQFIQDTIDNLIEWLAALYLDIEVSYAYLVLNFAALITAIIVLITKVDMDEHPIYNCVFPVLIWIAVGLEWWAYSSVSGIRFVLAYPQRWSGRGRFDPGGAREAPEALLCRTGSPRSDANDEDAT